MEFEMLSKAASQGDVDAMFALGKLLLEGKKGPHDPLTGEKWLKKAARKKHPEALFAMGTLMLEAENPRLALAYFKRSDRQGFPQAKKMIGHLYRGDFDPEAAHLRKAKRYFLAYYAIDKIDALEPLLALYDNRLFASGKAEKRFLQEAADYGLLKAQYYLGKYYLEHEKDYAKALNLLENYFAATADVNAAKLLYQLYDPHESTYPKFPDKNPQRADVYLRQAIASDGILEGAEFLYERPTYLPNDVLGTQAFLERLVRRMKTSLAIDSRFADTVTSDVFETELLFNIETVSKIKANWTYKLNEIKETHVEKTIQKKQKVKKGLKTTGIIKIPETVTLKKTERHSVQHTQSQTLEQAYQKLPLTHTRMPSLKYLLHTMQSETGAFDFSKIPTEASVKYALRNTLWQAFERPKAAKKIRLSFDYDYVYRLMPHLQVSFVYEGQRYESTHPLFNTRALDGLSFPLDTDFAKTLARFKRHQAARQKNQRFFTVFSSLLLMILLKQLSLQRFPDTALMTFLKGTFLLDVLIFSGGALFGFVLWRMSQFNRIDASTYIKHSDDDDWVSLKKQVRQQTLKMMLCVGIGVVLALLVIWIESAL